jgi:uncharacterized repeat protein (TIGR03803 family)
MWIYGLATPSIRRLFITSVAAVATLSLPMMAIAQTVAGLYEYPGTNNNTTGLTNTASIAQGLDGNNYMSDQTDGEYGLGSVYDISPAGNPTTLYSFCEEGGSCSTTGALPFGGVTLGSDGNFYGTVQNGGTYGFGQVVKLTSKGVRTTVYNFTGALPGDGGAPDYPVFLATDGDLWGVQNNSCGGVFKVTLKGVISNYAFDCTNGSNPNLPTEGSDGNFYGTTIRGGDASCGGCGVIYKVTPAGKITVLYTFTASSSDGAYPYGVLVEGSDGNYWGVAEQGGTVGAGSIFKISPSGKFTQVYSFTGAPDGAYPITGLTLGSDGNFYGTTNSGGENNAGAIFEITTSGKYSVLYSFVPSTVGPGFGPCTVMFQNTNGIFYGNTCGNSLGGSYFYSLNMGLSPFVRTVSPSGQVGATIEFLGQNFTGTTEVEFAGVAATFKVVSATELTAVVPTTAVTGLVSVVTPSGKLTATSNFLVLPTIKTIAPDSGPTGTLVTVTGSGLTGATSVTVDGKTASFTVVSSTEITVTVPSTAKTGKIVVTTKGGSATSTTFTVT